MRSTTSVLLKPIKVYVAHSTAYLGYFLVLRGNRGVFLLYGLLQLEPRSFQLILQSLVLGVESSSADRSPQGWGEWKTGVIFPSSPFSSS